MLTSQTSAALSQLKKKSADTLRNGTAWVVSLRILMSQAFKDGHKYVSDPISDVTDRELSKPLKTQGQRIMENIAKAFEQRRYDDVIQQIDAFTQFMRYDSPNFLRRHDQFSDKEKQDMLDRVTFSEAEAKFGKSSILCQ